MRPTRNALLRPRRPRPTTKTRSATCSRAWPQRGDTAMRALVQRLHADHLAMAQQWAAVRVDLLAVAMARRRQRCPTPRAWAAFAALYRSHIAAEEAQAYPAARTLSTPPRSARWAPRWPHAAAPARVPLMHKPRSLSAKLGAIGGSAAADGAAVDRPDAVGDLAARRRRRGRQRSRAHAHADLAPGADAGRRRRRRASPRWRRAVRPAASALLRSGDPSRPLFVPRDARSQAAFADVQHELAGAARRLEAASPAAPLDGTAAMKPRCRPRPSSATSTASSRPSRASWRG